MKFSSILKIDLSFYNITHFYVQSTLKQRFYILRFNVSILSPKLLEGSVCVLFLFSDSKVKNSW